MKKFLFVVTLSLSTLGVAETTATHSPSTAGQTPAVQSGARSTVSSQDKALKLEQYINACLVKRPSGQEDLRKLLQ